MSNLFDYSQTPASNNSSPPDGAPEGMAPSEVNNTIRQMMANQAGAFQCYTAGGSADAQTVTMDPALAAYSTKVRIAFIPVANNTGACTLNVNGLGAVSIKLANGSDPGAGSLNSSGVALVQHNGTNFILLNPAVNFIVEDTTITLDNDFTAGDGRLIVTRVSAGNICQFILTSPVTHASTTAADSTALIPSTYRPSGVQAQVALIGFGAEATVRVFDTGVIRVSYGSTQTGISLGGGPTWYVAD